MFSHVFIGVRDFQRAVDFYTPLLALLGLERRFCDPAQGLAAWQHPPAPRPLFLVGTPFDRQPHDPGNGQMTAFLAETRELVDRVYADALHRGATSEGAPGPRPHYHAHYYGAYFRDLDGNKLCVACHVPHAAGAA